MTYAVMAYCNLLHTANSYFLKFYHKSCLSIWLLASLKNLASAAGFTCLVCVTAGYILVNR